MTRPMKFPAGRVDSPGPTYRKVAYQRPVIAGWAGAWPWNITRGVCEVRFLRLRPFAPFIYWLGLPVFTREKRDRYPYGALRQMPSRDYTTHNGEAAGSTPAPGT